MFLLVLLILVLLLLGGGGGYYGRARGWGPRGFSGLLVTMLIVLLLVRAVNELLIPPAPLPDGAPSIIR
jgi:hypothetical protein